MKALARESQHAQGLCGCLGLPRHEAGSQVNDSVIAMRGSCHVASSLTPRP